MQRIPQVFPGWQADELIGSGAYGKVYRASRDVGGYVLRAAVKVIDIPRDESEVSSLRQMGMDAVSIRSYFEETAQSLVSELAVMDALKGAPNVVGVEDYQMVERGGGVGWSVFIRMELLEDLPSYQAHAGAPGAREAARIGVDVCRALGFCHGMGVIHRDVKPENVFRSEFGEYKLGDFGLARRIDEGSRSTKSQAGSGPYMAPEIMTGHYDETVDVYSLGIMLYRWLNGGKPPFIGAGDTPTRAMLENAQMRRLAGERPPLPSGAGVDPALARIVRKACEPGPADRWRSAGEFGEALRAWLDGRPVRVAERGDDVRLAVSVPAEIVTPGGVVEVWYQAGEKSRRLSMRIPAGTRDGAVLRFAGCGCPGTGGTEAGDLIATISVPAPAITQVQQAPMAAPPAKKIGLDGTSLMRDAAILAMIAAFDRAYILAGQTGSNPRLVFLMLIDAAIAVLALWRPKGLEKILSVIMIGNFVWGCSLYVHLIVSLANETGLTGFFLYEIVNGLASSCLDAAFVLAIAGPRHTRRTSAITVAVCAAVLIAGSFISVSWGIDSGTTFRVYVGAWTLVDIAHSASLAILCWALAGVDGTEPKSVS